MAINPYFCIRQIHSKRLYSALFQSSFIHTIAKAHRSLRARSMSSLTASHKLPAVVVRRSKSIACVSSYCVLKQPKIISLSGNKLSFSHPERSPTHQQTTCGSSHRPSAPLVAQWTKLDPQVDLFRSRE